MSDEKKGLIYRVISPSGKSYVGKTIQNLEDRKARHIKRSKEKNEDGSWKYVHKFANAIRKHGDSLVWEVVEDNVSEQDLHLREIFYIEKFGSFANGYNTTPGGLGGDTYAVLSDSQLQEVKKKISKSLKKRFNNPEYRKKFSERSSGSNNPMYGKVSAMKGKSHSEESKKKISRKKKIRDLMKLECPRIIEKPWGSETILGYTSSYCFKRIIINKGHATSLQYHELKEETNFLVSGRAKIWIKRVGEPTFTIIEEAFPGAIISLKPGDVHRIEALEDCILHECSSPEIWDVIRLEDSYNRQGTSAP